MTRLTDRHKTIPYFKRVLVSSDTWGRSTFDYAANPLSDDVEQLAASTNNPNYAAKMLGYDRATFGDMIHSMKDDLNLVGPITSFGTITAT